MALRRTIVFLVVVAAGSVVKSRESAAYTFVDIHGQITPSHSVQTTATGVNAGGIVVGNFDDLTTSRGFVDSNGVVQFLPSPVASDPLQFWDCHPTAINGSGTIAGWCELLQPTGEPNVVTQLDVRATIWTGQPYALTLLPRLPDSSQQQALGINEQGQVMGAYQVPGDQFITTVGRAFAWDATNGIRALPVLHGHEFGALIECFPAGIDGRGRIVGNCDDPNTGRQMGFINDGDKTVPLPASHEDAVFPLSVVDISESGLIVAASNDQNGTHTWTVDDNHVTPVPELDGLFFPVRIVNSGAILAENFSDLSIVVDAVGAVQQVAGPGTFAIDMNEGGAVVGYVIGDVLASAAEWVP
jgi:hypothetical protein